MDKACYPNWWLWMINFIITELNFLIPLLFSSIALLQCFGDCWTNLTEKMGSSLSFIASASHCPCQVSIFVCPVRTSCNICLSESTCEFLDLFPSLFHTLSLLLFITCTHDCAFPVITCTERYGRFFPLESVGLATIQSQWYQHDEWCDRAGTVRTWFPRFNIVWCYSR